MLTLCLYWRPGDNLPVFLGMYEEMVAKRKAALLLYVPSKGRVSYDK
jgi:hypothetical protein